MKTESMIPENVKTNNKLGKYDKICFLNEFLQLITSLFIKVVTYLYYKSGGGEVQVNGGK